MLVENQYIEIRWNNYIKRWYQDKGYIFTKNGDLFSVNVLDLMNNSSAKVNVICDYCGSSNTISYVDYTKNTKGNKKYACKKCSGKKRYEYSNNREKYFNIFLEACKEHSCTPLSSIDDYVNVQTKLKYWCPKHGLQEITYASISAGCWCNLCGFERSAKKNSRSIDEVINIVECKNNNKLLNPEEYINTKTKNLKVICGLCGRIFITSLASIMVSDGACSLCGIRKSSGHNKLSKEEVEYRINSVNDNVLLNPEDYLDNSTINLKIRCGECGETFVTSLRNYEYDNKIRCDSCTRKISSLERFGISVFSKYKINYIYNHRFEDCRDMRPLPFDFYLPDYNMCVEFDGQHHFEPKWGEERFKKTLLHDGMKNNYCRWNNIKLLRIPYWDGNNIEDILVKELNLKPKHNKIVYIPTAQRKQNKTA